jgi:cytochrome P450
VSRYDDVQTVLKSPELFSSRAMFTMLMNNGQEGVPPLTWPFVRFIVKTLLRTRMNPFAFATARNLIAEDGDRHSAMRTIVNRGFTPRRVASWEKRAREVAEASVAGLRAGEPFDLIEDLAVPLPVTIIAEMLGVERDRLKDFKRWSDAIVHNATGPGRDDPYNDDFIDSMCEVMNYVIGIVRQRRRAPADDVISAIVAQQDGDVALTDREVVQFVILLLVAGNETTTNLIGNTVTALLDHPDQLARAVADPARIPAVLEEGLRFDSPIQLVFRITTRDVEIAGTSIAKGEFVAALVGSANRDERQFPDPDRFDIDRDTRGHVGFGFGTHFCLGASLARLEAKVALETLVPELPRLERAQSSRELVDSFLVRGPRHLRLRPAA